MTTDSYTQHTITTEGLPTFLTTKYYRSNEEEELTNTQHSVLITNI